MDVSCGSVAGVNYTAIKLEEKKEKKIGDRVDATVD
jgi:hypothetical protein